jgi:hypothetical protein
MNIFKWCIGSTVTLQHSSQQVEDGSRASRQPGLAPLSQMSQPQQPRPIESPRTQVARQPVGYFDAPTLNICFPAKRSVFFNEHSSRVAQVRYLNSRKALTIYSSHNKLSRVLTRNCQNVTKLVVYLGTYNISNLKKNVKLPIIKLAHTIKQLKPLTKLSLILMNLPESNSPRDYLHLCAATKSLRQLTSLSVSLNLDGRKYIAAVVPGLARLHHLNEFAIDYPLGRCTALDEITLKLGELKQITWLRLDFRFGNIMYKVIQELASNFKQLTQLTQLVLKLNFNEYALCTDNADKMELPQWFALLGGAIQQLHVLKVLKLDINRTVSWDEAKNLLLSLEFSTQLEQIEINLGFFGLCWA